MRAMSMMSCAHLKESQKGRFAIERFTVSEEEAQLFNWRAHGRYITSGEYVRLRDVENDIVWMSDTPAERQDHLSPFFEMQHLGGTVLIFGLGIGMIVHAALQLDNVEKVIVVEREQDIITLVGDQISHPKLEIVKADAFTLKPVDLVPLLGTDYRLSVMYADIWPDLNPENLQQYTLFKKRWAKRAETRFCWAEETIRAHQSRYRVQSY